MSDNLEKFVRNNREQFDRKEPREDLWNRIQQDLGQGGTPDTNGASAAKQAATAAKKALTWKIAASVAVGVTIVASVWYASNLLNKRGETQSNAPANQAQTNQVEPDRQAAPFINPPVAKASVPYHNFQVDAEKGGKISLPNGTLIDFPEASFLHADGSPVTGTVEIQYREFHDAADIILSGIPMTYDNNGKGEIFETAGMIEILGFQNGNPVSIAPGKSVNFEMATYATEDNYNFYYLDPEKKHWTDLEKPKMGKNKRKSSAKSGTVAEEPVAPRKPIDPKSLGTIEEIGFAATNASDFPELKPFRNIRWVAKDKQYLAKNQWIFTKVWSDIRIQEIPGEEMAYNMVLKNKQGTFTLPALPVLEGDDYKKALKNFNEQKAKYDKTLSQRKAEADRIQRQADLIYSFKITGFGIFNCDRFYKSGPDAVAFTANFDFEDGVFAQGSTIRVFHILSDRSVRTIEDYARPQSVKMLRNDQQAFVALLANGEAAMVSADDLAKMDLKDGAKVTLHMKSTGVSVANGDDLRKLLKI